ncbi:hypothetical protein [Streptomyces sp. NBC_01314]|uniref:hypothetical protein n=1 Tax=Streptomyces sp. NBC_01314 TaxID=2903821 RepID=UPI00308D5865|nr:hypothetical protein OG622_42655 [Streptomyces sp. NBC_01314]
MDPEQSYKQVKDELGRADFQVRSDRAIRRHQTLVNRAFSLCCDQWFAPRWWRAWTDKDPPSELQALIDAVTIPGWTGRRTPRIRRSRPPIRVPGRSTR